MSVQKQKTKLKMPEVELSPEDKFILDAIRFYKKHLKEQKSKA